MPLKPLSSTQWGGDPSTLSMLYKAIIRSKMEYGSFLFGSATNANINKLDIIQNQALRFILGAIKTTPISAMEAEAKIPPLRLRRLHLAQKYLIRLSAWTNKNIIHKFVYIARHWRCVPSKTPILASLGIKHINLLIALPSIRGYPFYNTEYFNIFHRWPLIQFTPENHLDVPT